MTPEQRRLRARIAANARWSRPMARTDQAVAARAAILARLERQVDPAGSLTPEERAALVRSAGRRLGAELNAARARKRRLLRSGPEQAEEVLPVFCAGSTSFYGKYHERRRNSLGTRRKHSRPLLMGAFWVTAGYWFGGHGCAAGGCRDGGRGRFRG